MRGAWLLATLSVAQCATPAWASAPPPVRVEITGEVQHPGARQLPDGARFADAVLAAMPTALAYPLGAAVLRPSALPEQRRRKAGVAYDLEAIGRDPGVAVAMQVRASVLRQWLDALPVTGRVPVQLDARRLEVDVRSNRILAEGDRFVYPRRPATIRIVGAVTQSCTLAHEPLRDAIEYLRDCAIDRAAADRNILYVIQPDGRVQPLGIAPWNRSAPQALAPGAMVYVPLDEAALGAAGASLNRDVADFLATQPLSAETP